MNVLGRENENFDFSVSIYIGFGSDIEVGMVLLLLVCIDIVMKGYLFECLLEDCDCSKINFSIGRYSINDLELENIFFYKDVLNKNDFGGSERSRLSFFFVINFSFIVGEFDL